MRKWDDNIKVHLKETEFDGVALIHLAKDKDWWRAVVNAVMYLVFLLKKRRFS
jgi:hypothetical protein